MMPRLCAVISRVRAPREIENRLRIFWLPLASSERIERLGSEDQRVFLLQNGGFDEGNANRTNCVLSRAAITAERKPV
jgi:hypothetical protein